MARKHDNPARRSLLRRIVALGMTAMLALAGMVCPALAEGVIITGDFYDDEVYLTIGDISTVQGEVMSAGSNLNRVTYQIEGWYGDDENNRYCTQAAGGDYVNLGGMQELVLDTTRAPLNQAGTYTLWLVASTESGDWDKLDCLTIHVEEAYVEPYEEEPAHSEEVDWSDSVDDGASWDEYDDSSEWDEQDDAYVPAAELRGEFARDSIALKLGDVTRVEGRVGSKNYDLAQVTYQIDGWYGEDENNRYCTQAVYGTNQVDLAQMSGLVLDTNNPPLNQPGTYTLWVVARAEDGSWDRLDSMQVIVAADETVDAGSWDSYPNDDLGDVGSQEPAHSDEVVDAGSGDSDPDDDLGDVGSQEPASSDEVVVPESSGQISYMPTAELKGYFTEDSIALKLGDVTRVEGRVGCKNDTLVQVTYQIDGWSGTDESNRYCTQAVSGVNQVDLAQMSGLVLDTNNPPLNQPGTYTLRLVARAADGSWRELDSAIIQVISEQVVNGGDAPGAMGVSELSVGIDGTVYTGYMNKETGIMRQLGSGHTLWVETTYPAGTDRLEFYLMSAGGYEQPFIKLDDFDAKRTSESWIFTGLEPNGGIISPGIYIPKNLKSAKYYVFVRAWKGEEKEEVHVEIEIVDFPTDHPNTYENVPGQPVANLIGVARSQTGYKASSGKHQKYGYEFNKETGWRSDWCAYFVSWCAKEAGVTAIQPYGSANPRYLCPNADITYFYEGYLAGPDDGNPMTLNAKFTYDAAEWIMQHGTKGNKSTDGPKPGDLVFFRWKDYPNKAVSVDHVGIVTTVRSAKDYDYIDGNGGSDVSEQTIDEGKLNCVVCYASPEY